MKNLIRIDAFLVLDIRFILNKIQRASFDFLINFTDVFTQNSQGQKFLPFSFSDKFS